MQTSDVPPTRKSILASGQVKPSTPHHCITYSGSLQAFHTSSTGASKTRVTTRSRFSGPVLICASPSCSYNEPAVLYQGVQLHNAEPCAAWWRHVYLKSLTV